MKNSLISYLNDRLQDDKKLNEGNEKQNGPVITISREVGCNAIKLAELIRNRLNCNNPATKWRILSKEIFHESAKELKLNPDEVQKVFKQTEKYAFEDILKAFSVKHYVSERKIVKTVVDIIHGFAAEGNFILVGRASHIISKDIKRALHIRLFAPFEYRIYNIMQNNGLTIAEAEIFIHRVENERIAFRNAIHENNLNEHIFDVTFNRATFSDEALVDMIEFAAKKKNVI